MGNVTADLEGPGVVIASLDGEETVVIKVFKY